MEAELEMYAWLINHIFRSCLNVISDAINNEIRQQKRNMSQNMHRKVVLLRLYYQSLAESCYPFIHILQDCATGAVKTGRCFTSPGELAKWIVVVPHCRGCKQHPNNILLIEHDGHTIHKFAISVKLICGSSPSLWNTNHHNPEPVVFQWHSSGNPVCLELKPQCTLECHWKNNCW